MFHFTVYHSFEDAALLFHYCISPRLYLGKQCKSVSCINLIQHFDTEYICLEKSLEKSNSLQKKWCLFRGKTTFNCPCILRREKRTICGVSQRLEKLLSFGFIQCPHLNPEGSLTVWTYSCVLTHIILPSSFIGTLPFCLSSNLGRSFPFKPGSINLSCYLFFLSFSQSIPTFYYHSWTKHISAITPLPQAVLRPLQLTL